MRIIHGVKAMFMERYQIINPIDLIQRKIRIDAMSQRCTGNEPSTADTAFEFVAIECIGTVHDKLKIVEFSPTSVGNYLGSMHGIHLVQPRIDTLLFRAFEVYLPACLGIRCFILVLWECLLPITKGERSEADIDIAVFYRGNLLLMLLMDAREILCLICWNPFSFILLQPTFCYHL